MGEWERGRERERAIDVRYHIELGGAVEVRFEHVELQEDGAGVDGLRLRQQRVHEDARLAVEQEGVRLAALVVVGDVAHQVCHRHVDANDPDEAGRGHPNARRHQHACSHPERHMWGAGHHLYPFT